MAFSQRNTIDSSSPLQLRPLFRPLQPAAAERLVEMNYRLHVRQRDLDQLILCQEQSLLRLQHGEQVGGSLAVLKLGNLKGFPRSVDLALEMLLRLAVVPILTQHKNHNNKNKEHGTLITGDQLLLRSPRQGLV